MEDLLQSIESIKIAYAKALLVDYDGLKAAQMLNDVAAAQFILQDAFRTDVRPLVKESIYRKGGALDPVAAYRTFDIRNNLIKLRGLDSKSNGIIMKKQCCLVFDVGKTNQKYFLFDADYKILKREKVTLLKIEDEDGDSAENIQGIVAWMKQKF